jgi:RHS repeat-associated protein
MKQFSVYSLALVVVVNLVASDSQLLVAEQVNLVDPGSTVGAFQVAADGSSGYTIPIKCPPGTAGMKPSIALSYNSQAPTGTMGPGWSINGYSLITRGPKNLVTDGIVDGVNFDKSDALFLDGTRLIPVEAPSDQAFIEYRKEIDDHTRVRGYGNDANGHTNFRVWTKGGSIRLFGFSADSTPRRADGTPILWLCNQIEDTAGNFIAFKYEQHDGGDYNLSRVDYTGNANANLAPYASIVLEYENLADIETTQGKGLPVTVTYFAGEKVSRNFRLKQIRSYYQDRLMRKYTLGYTMPGATGPEVPTNSLCGFQLRSINESGHDGRSYRPTTFVYTDSLRETNQAWKSIPNFAPPFDLDAPSDFSADGLGVVYANLDGVGGEDLVYSAVVGSTRIQKVFLNDGSKWLESANFVLPLPLAQGGKKQNGIELVDLNNDGLVDVLVDINSKSRYAMLNEKVNSVQTWVDKPNLLPPVPLSVDGLRTGYLLADVTADGHLDFLWYSQDKDGSLSKGAAKFSGDKWDMLGDEFAPPKLIENTSESFITAIDLNADSRSDLIYWSKGNKRPSVYLMSDEGWKLADEDSGFIPEIPFPTNPAAVMAIDLDGDKADELIVSFKDEANEYNFVFAANAGGLRKWDSEKSLPIKLINDSGIPNGVRFPDLNGDGKLDVLVSTRFVGAGAELRTAFIQADDKWNVPDLNFLPPHALAIVADRRLTHLPAFLSDLDGDKRTDLVYQTSVAMENVFIPAKNTFLNTDDGWEESVDFLPPFAIAKAETTDLGVRFVDFNGDGLTDILSSFKPKEGDVTSEARINLGAGWSITNAEKWQPKYHLAEEAGSDTGVVFVDVNGDARVDMLVHREFNDDQKPAVKHAFINDSEQGWVESNTWQPPVPITKDEYGNKGTRFIDLNGDGLTDVISSLRKKDGSVEHRAWLNDGTKWVESPEYRALPNGFSFAQEIPPLTKDGNPQLIPPSAFNEWNKIVVSRGLGAVLVDLNNDRLPDIAYHHEVYSVEVVEQRISVPRITFYRLTTKRETVKGALLNTGTGWVEATHYAPPQRLDIETGKELETRSSTQDVNGDGLPDLVYISYIESKNESKIFLNTGAGFTAEPSTTFKIPDAAFSAGAATEEARGDHGIRLMDINGDGLVDILKSFRNKEKANETGAWLNNGESWVPTANYVPTVSGNTLVFASESGEDTGVRTLDINGDFIEDIFVWKKDTSGADEKATFINQSLRRDILTSVTDGMDFRVQFYYRTMTVGFKSDGTPFEDRGGHFYTAAKSPGTYPILAAVPPVHAVEQVSMFESGNQLSESYRYRYGGFRVNSKRGSPLGFEWQETINMATGMSQWSQYAQDEHLVGRKLVDEVRHNPNFLKSSDDNPSERIGNKQTSTFTDWGVEVRNGLKNSAGTNFRFVNVHLKKSTNTLFDLGGEQLGSQVDTFMYDTFGNAEIVESKRSDGSGSRIDSQFENHVDSWHLGRLKKSTSTLFNAEGDKLKRSAEFDYHAATGMLSKELTFAGTPKAVTISYEYDAFGNKVKSITSADNIGSRSVEVFFDPTGRFPVKNVNALGHTKSAEYDPVFGQALVVKNYNGVISRFEYDSHGSTTKEISPTGVESITLRRFLATPVTMRDGSVASLEVTSKTGELPATRLLLDSQGRTLRSVSIGGKGREILQDTQYDEFRRPSRVSDPYFEGVDKEVLWTVTQYDVSGRPIRIRTADGNETTYVYNGLTTVFRDRAGREFVKTYNIRKQLIKSSDLNGEINYQYDVGGRLVRIVNVDKTQTLHKFDDYGQKVESIDPNLGRWTYEYNALGELVKQTDAKNQSIELSYDLIGRVTKKTQPDGQSTWEYDRSKNGIGKISRVVGSDGYVEIWNYDEFGRNTQTTVHAGYDVFSSATEFDSLNRPTRLIYPTGFSIRHEYDAYGFLTSVANADSGHAYWTSVDLNQHGQITSERFGNNVSTTRNYDNTTGQIESITTLNPLGQQVIDQEFDYDISGNMIRRKDKVHKTDERFEFDQADRLVKTTTDETHFQTVSYDRVGRILDKSDVGFYNYAQATGGSAPAHAVSSISRLDGSVSILRYDNNGNLLSNGKNDYFAYNSSNHTTAIRHCNGNQSHFRYTPSGRLYFHDRQVSGSAETSVKLGLFEQVRVGQHKNCFAPHKIIKRHFIVAPTGVCAIAEDVVEFEGSILSRNLHGIRHDCQLYTHTADRYFVRYLHSDPLGSVSAVTDIGGRILKSNRTDPWGKSTESRVDTQLASFHKEFTGHESLDHLGLVHMGGRVYDPLVAMFTSADPLTQSFEIPDSMNKFCYALNNPLKYVDPTGYGWNPVKALGDGIRSVGNAIGSAAAAVGDAFSTVGKFVKENWKQIVVMTVTIVVAAVVTYATAGLGSPIAAGMLAGAAAGFAGGGLSAALHGGDFNDIMGAAVRGAVLGGISGALMGGAAQLTVNFAPYYQAPVMGLAGGGSSAMQGGDFWAGFAGGALGSLSAGYVRGFEGETAARVASAAVVGGTVEEIRGGEFANGARTGAFSQIVSEGVGSGLRAVEERNSRPMTSYEIEQAKSVFGDKIDYSRVRIVDGKFAPFQPDRGTYMAPNGKIYWPGCSSQEMCGNAPVFIHELTHVMQAQNGIDVQGQGLMLQTGQLFGNNPYEYQYEHGKPFTSYNIEQQGDIARDIYRWQQSGQYGPYPFSIK